MPIAVPFVSRESMGSRRPRTRGTSTFRPEDLGRAFICSDAVFLESTEDVSEYLENIKSEFPFAQFGKVLLSDEGENSLGLMFLVAYSTDAIFIAFRGSPNFEDHGQDLQSSRPSDGKLHGGVLELSESFMVSSCKLLVSLLIEGKESGKRIVFCGHRLGGAVAHMVVLRFWSENGIDEIKLEEHPDSMISIAFGAPNICSRAYADEVYKKCDENHLKSHFFNFIDEDDPFTSSLDVPGEFYSSIGQVIDLGGGQHRHSSTSKLISSCVQMSRPKPWTLEKFSKSYKSAVITATLDVPDFPDANPDIEPPKLVVSTPGPKITSAKRKASDSGSIIVIRGSNLLFLSEPVKLDGLYPWETKLQTDTELLIFASSNTKMDHGTKALSKVVLRTAFGATVHVVTEDGTLDETSTGVPLRLLSRNVQTFFIKAIPPMCILPEISVLEDLDGIVQCVPELKDKKLSTLLIETAARTEDKSEEDIIKNIDEINDVVKTVIEFLTRSYILKREQMNLLTILGCVAGSLLLIAGLVMLPVGGVALTIGGATILAATVTTAGALAFTGGGSVMAVSLGKGQVVVREYTEMLQVAIHEASHWHDNKNAIDNSTSRADVDNKLSHVAALELALHNEVRKSNKPYLAEMIEKIKNSESYDITLHSSNLKDASSDSKNNLVRRMHIVVKTIDMFNKEVKGTQFLGLVGAEDAGKSTFIKKALQKYGVRTDAELPKDIGYKSHTRTVMPYKLKHDLQIYLVDFPGSNGTENYAEAWRQFRSLPSSCILLISFMGDIKKDQVEMYTKMKNDLDSNVVVVFNKVDQIFTPSKEAEFDSDYFSNHRRNTAEKLGCACKDVHYASLDPDPEERLIKLRKVGVLGFEELADKLLHIDQ